MTRRGFLGWALAVATAPSRLQETLPWQDQDLWTTSGILREQSAGDPALVFYTLTFGREGSILLSLDTDLPLARWLAAHRGQRVGLTLVAGEPIRR